MGDLRRHGLPRQPHRQWPHRPRRGAGRVGERDAPQLRGVPAVLVRHPQGRRGDEQHQHRVQGRLPLMDHQPGGGPHAVHQRCLPRPAALHPRRGATARTGDRGAGWGAHRARPRRYVGTPRRADGRPRHGARCRPRLDRRRPHHVHIGHHRPQQGRDQAERGRLLLGARVAGVHVEAPRGGGGRHACRDLVLVPAAVPQQRAGAHRLPGAHRRRARGVRGALLGHPLLAAGHRHGRHHVQRHRGHALLPVEPAAVRPGPRPLGALGAGRPGAA